MVTATGAYSCVRAHFGLKHEPRFKVDFKYRFVATKQTKYTSEGNYAKADAGQNHGCQSQLEWVLRPFLSGYVQISSLFSRSPYSIIRLPTLIVISVRFN